MIVGALDDQSRRPREKNKPKYTLPAFGLLNHHLGTVSLAVIMTWRHRLEMGGKKVANSPDTLVSDAKVSTRLGAPTTPVFQQSPLS